MNELDVRGRTAVITGGASGIGLAIARRLLASGAVLSLWDTRADILAEASTEQGDAHTSVVDVRDYASVERARDATLAALGRIDVLVNSAGITGPNAATWDYPLDAWRDVLDVNLTGTFHCCRAVVAPMRGTRLRPHRQHRLGRRQGRQPERERLQRVQSRRDRADEVARQGARADRHPRQLRHARRGARRRYSSR